MRKVFEQEGIDPLTTDVDELYHVWTKAREWYLALAFLMVADCTRYGRLLENYENDFTQGVDCYLHMRKHAFNILANYKEDEQNYMQVVQSNDSVAFTTLDDSNSHHNTTDDNITPPTDKLSTTSNLTTSTNPQQHGSTLVTTGGGRRIY